MNKVLTFGKFDFPLPRLEHREDVAVLRIEWIDDATPARIDATTYAKRMRLSGVGSNATVAKPPRAVMYQ